jgi:hypothetical protein
MDERRKARLESLKRLKQDFMSPGELSEGTKKYSNKLRGYGESSTNPLLKNNFLKEAADREAAEVLLKSNYDKMEDAALRMSDEFEDMAEFHRGPYGSPSHLDDMLNNSKIKKGLKMLKGGASKVLPFVGPAIGAGLALSSGDANAALGDLLGSDSVGEGSDEPKYDLSPADVKKAERRAIEAMSSRKNRK